MTLGEQVPDDRNDLQPDDAVLMIVEDEPHYCRVLVDLARGSGFKVLVAHRGIDALELARKPPAAIPDENTSRRVISSRPARRNPLDNSV